MVNKVELFKVVEAWFLDALAKLRKLTISFIMSICLSVCTEQLGCHWTNCDET
jgi:hypothetical protein